MFTLSCRSLPAAGCGQWSDKGSCESNGCTWTGDGRCVLRVQVASTPSTPGGVGLNTNPCWAQSSEAACVNAARGCQWFGAPGSQGRCLGG
jgi:hypothetical protein